MKKSIGSFVMFIIGLSLLFSFVSSGVIPAIFVLFFIFAISDSAKKKNKTGMNGKSKGLKGRKLNEFNKNIKLYFEDNDSIEITESISIKADKSKSPYLLYVYYNNEKICNIEEFSKYYPKTYMDLIEKAFELVVPTEYETLTKESKKKVEKKNVDVVSDQPAQKKETVKKDGSKYFIKVIDDLNVDITKEEITKDLYQTTAMLKQIQLIEEKYPESREKLVKLYQYYLPILVDILESYVKLMSSNSTHTEIDSVELKLRKTIVLVNEALKTITMQLCEDEIIDMKSDMSVLETILRKDGLVKDGTLFAEEKSVK